MPSSGKNQLNIALDFEKKEAFKEWARQRGTTVTELVNQFVEACLNGKANLDLTQPNLTLGREEVTSLGKR